MNLDFLKDLSLKETVVTTSRSHVDIAPAVGADLRVFKDGRVFPSADFVTTHNLEYVSKGDAVGNGFDIVDTNEFPGYPEGTPRLVMVALTAKDNPKVDLFGSVGYDDDNKPKAEVTKQGSSTTGKWLIPMLEEVYGEELFPEGIRYVDLVIKTEFGITTPNNIYLLPKKVTRGANKGTPSYQRRTDTTLWPLVVFTLEEETATLEIQTDMFESQEGKTDEDSEQHTLVDGDTEKEGPNGLQIL
jgi:hypothetical protein